LRHTIETKHYLSWGKLKNEAREYGKRDSEGGKETEGENFTVSEDGRKVYPARGRSLSRDGLAAPMNANGEKGKHWPDHDYRLKRFAGGLRGAILQRHPVLVSPES